MKEESIKFENGSEIETIPCNDNVRGKRAEMFKEYYKHYPEVYIEEILGAKLSLWQKLLIKYWYGRKK